MNAENPSSLTAGITASETNIETNANTDSNPWKSYDPEDVSLLFSIIYRAIFNEDIFVSTDSMKKEILIDGENREFKMPNANKLVKVITEEALKRIVKLGYFETIVKIIFEEKYPEIKHKQLDLEAIINNILQNFKSIGETHKLISEGGEEKATDEDIDLIEYETNLKVLHDKLLGVTDKIKAFGSQIQDLPQKIIENLTKTKKVETDQAREKSNLSVKNLTEAKLKMEEEKKGSEDSTRKNSRVTKSSGEDSSNPKNGSGSNQMSKNSSMSVSHSNGNGSHDSNERCELEDFEKEGIVLASSKDTYQEKNKLPKRATDILQAWFLKNIDHPYPSSEAKEVLRNATGLNMKQIQNWFTNSRKRCLEPIKKKMGNESKDQKSGASQLIGEENAPVIVQEQGWQQSPANQQPNNVVTTIDPAFQNLQPYSQPLPQPNMVLQPTMISQPMVMQNPTEPIQQSGYYYTNTAQNYATQPQGGQFYPMNYMQPPTGQILVPTGYYPQPQANPMYYNATPQGAYIVVNHPVQNFVPMGMVPMNGPYLAPMQAYPIVDQNSFPSNQGMVDMRGMYAHNLSTNFNTIHNNVFNNINHTNTFPQQRVGYSQPVYVSATPQPSGVFIEESKINTQQQVNDVTRLDLAPDGKSNQDLYDEERSQTQRIRESYGNSAYFLDSQPEKKVHKDDNGTPTNAFSKPQ